LTTVGIDIGTFHTLAVAMGSGALTIPPRSVPSIALLGHVPIVGFDAITQMDLGFPLLQAPKLEMGSQRIERGLICSVLRKLANQSMAELAMDSNQPLVVTVPPGWDLDQCNLLQEALALDGSHVQFLHEPIALLVAAWYLAPRHEDPAFRAKLGHFDEIVVCDWGAGTVDLAVVSIAGNLSHPEFRCIGEVTISDWGGTSIARSAVEAFRNSGGTLHTDSERTSVFLQQHWAGTHPSPVPLASIDPFVSLERRNAAIAIQVEARRLIEKCKSPSKVLFLMHGGPLEADPLRAAFSEALVKIGVSRDRQMHIGNDFAKRISGVAANLRRESLVALGAALYAACGRSLPEFKYRVELRDAFGKVASSARLAISPHTKGIQPVHPPYTGVDYVVDVQQMRDDGSDTPMRKELAIHVRPGGILLYRIAKTGVGFARIEAIEARNLPVPKAYQDAIPAAVIMPERSTRFHLDFETLQ
jgi:hypothetical protein